VLSLLLQAWAFVEYLDDALGPLFDFLTSSGLDQSTFVMFTADNGPAVYADENPPQKKLVSDRMQHCTLKDC
jgi:arylsulfatase A-like enzyme